MPSWCGLLFACPSTSCTLCSRFEMGKTRVCLFGVWSLKSAFRSCQIFQTQSPSHKIHIPLVYRFSWSLMPSCCRRLKAVFLILHQFCYFVIGLILFGQNHLYVKMLFYKGFRYSEVFQKILKSEKSVPCQPFERSCHPVRTPICPLFHPSGRRGILSWRLDRPSIFRPDDVDFHPDHPLYREACVPACIRPDVSAARPDTSQYSTKLQILSKFIYGKIATTVRMTWIPVRTRFSLRQESQFKFNCPDASLPSFGRAYIRYGNCVINFNRLDACLSWSGDTHHRYGNCVLKINHPDDHSPWSGRAKPYMEITCNGHANVQTWLSNRKDFQRKSQKFWSHSRPSGLLRFNVRTAPIYFTTVAHLNLSL